MNPVMVNMGIQGKPGVISHWFWCPGCNDTHRIESPHWTWDGNLEAPTFDPSILVYSHKKFKDGIGSEVIDTPRCHSYIRGGIWQFLADCTHPLVGQSVAMVPVPDWLVR